MTDQATYAGFHPCAYEGCERWINGPEPYCSPEHKQRAPRVFVDARTMTTINLDATLEDAERRLEKARQTFVTLSEEVADIRTRIARYDLGWGADDGTS